MKRSNLVRFQLAAFALLAVASLTYGLIQYVSVERLTGFRTYTVTAEFTDAGGLYENSLVTYRGTDVGLVTSIQFAGDSSVRVDLRIRNAAEIPASSTATIRSMSAVGEQFVDLEPDRNSGPYLVDRSIIPLSQTSSPTPASDVLDSANALLRSIPEGSLETAVGSISDTLDGTGPSLSQLIDSSSELVDLAQANINPTIGLIDDAEPLLNTGNAIAPDIRSSVSDLSSFTEQLVLSDGGLRDVLDRGPSAAATVSETLADLQPTLPVLLANLQSVGQVFRVNLPGLQQILVIYPALSAVLNHSVTGFQLDADTLGPQAPLDIKLGNTLNPPPCTEGYQGIERRDPSDTEPLPAVPGSYCDVQPDDPKVSRGVRNTPCATDPAARTADVANCPRGLPSTWTDMLMRPGDTVTGSGPGSTVTRQPPLTLPYNDIDGTFRSPEGVTYILGDAVRSDQQGKESGQWQSLLIK